MNCTLCEQRLKKNEEGLCVSCLEFVQWKYGDKESFDEERKSIQNVGWKK